MRHMNKFYVILAATAAFMSVNLDEALAAQHDAGVEINHVNVNAEIDSKEEQTIKQVSYTSKKSRGSRSRKSSCSCRASSFRAFTHCRGADRIRNNLYFVTR